MPRLPAGRWALLAALFFSLPAAPQNAQFCASCHGADGNSQQEGTPSLAGQPKLFLETQLILFREGLRPSPVMQPIAKGMKDPEISALSGHFSRLPAKRVTEAAADPKLVERGKAVAGKLRCGVCHAPDFRGQAQIPRLAWQREDYLAAELTAYRDNKRTAGDTTMLEVMQGVPDADIRALAHFLSRQP